MKNLVKFACVVALFCFMGCKVDIEKIAKEDNIRGEAKENLRLCEMEKDFKACLVLADAYHSGRMAKQSDEKALLYDEKSCQLRNEAYSKLTMPKLDELKTLRGKYGINPCESVAITKILQFGFEKVRVSAMFRSEKAKEIMPFYEQSCLNGEYANISCFMSADYHLFKGNFDKAKEFGLYACLKGENHFKDACKHYSENVLKQKPYLD